MKLDKLKREVAKRDREELMALENLRRAKERVAKAKQNTAESEAKFPSVFSLKLSECTVNGVSNWSAQALKNKLMRGDA